MNLPLASRLQTILDTLGIDAEVDCWGKNPTLHFADEREAERVIEALREQALIR